MYREKTASYTFELPLRLASIVSDSQDSRKLAEIGRNLGVLFQIRDDHIELFSNGETGKPDLSDIMQNKKTVHRRKLLEKAGNPEQIKGKMEGETSREEAEEVLESFRENDVEEVMRQEIRERKSRLEKKIQELENGGLSELLHDVVEMVVERQK